MTISHLVQSVSLQLLSPRPYLAVSYYAVSQCLARLAVIKMGIYSTVMNDCIGYILFGNSQ